MNIWTEKSFKIAMDNGYLDSIYNIYPVDQRGVENRISQDEIREIKELLDADKWEELISKLLKINRFPFDDPYIGFLRYEKDALTKNPKTLTRLAEHLKELNIEGIVSGINRPKSASRKFGNYFQKWLYQNFKTLDEENFLASKKGVFALEGGDKKLALFAKKYLLYNRKKGLDFVVKVNNLYVIGESKFTSSIGGGQNNSLSELMNLIKPSNKKCVTVGLLDGVHWVAFSAKSKDLHNLNENENIMSTLLFKDFIKHLS